MRQLYFRIKSLVFCQLYLNVSGQHQPVLLLDVSTLQVPELHLDVQIGYQPNNFKKSIFGPVPKSHTQTGLINVKTRGQNSHAWAPLNPQLSRFAICETFLLNSHLFFFLYLLLQLLRKITSLSNGKLSNSWGVLRNIVRSGYRSILYKHNVQLFLHSSSTFYLL
jgi:hypothetical protein